MEPHSAGEPLRLSQVRHRLAQLSADYEARVLDAAAAPAVSSPTPGAALLQHFQRIPELHPVVWVPFPDDAPSRQRRIHLLQLHHALGSGTFGIVFAVAIETDPTKNSDDPEVVLAAMKMLPILKHHGQELTNSMAANDLVRAGCTPSVLRLIDSFCITTVSSVTRCEMPPGAWSEGFWDEYDRFVYDHAQLLIETYGANILWEAPNHSLRTARVNAGAPVGFLFTELSLGFLVRNVGASLVGNSPPVSLSSSGPIKRLSPALIPTPFPLRSSGAFKDRSMGGAVSMADTLTPEVEWSEQFSRGLLTTAALVSHCYQRLQAVDALHASRLLHRDIHDGNWLFSPSPVLRSAHCLLETPDGREARTHRFGRPGFERPDDLTIGTQSHFVFRQGDTDEDRSVMAAPVHQYGASAMIDLGSASTPTFQEGEADDLPAVARYFFGLKEDQLKHSTAVYRQLPNFRTLSGSGEEVYEREPSPAFAVLTAAATSIYNRCPEQLNPYMIRRLVARPEFYERAHYLAFHSELSDVFSLAADQCQLILGYNIFGTTMRASTVSDSSSSDEARESIAKRSRGPRLVRVKPAKGVELTGATATTYELFHSFFKTTVYPIAAARLKSSSSNHRHPQQHHASSPLGPATTDWNDASGIFLCAFNYDCAPMMEYAKAMLLTQHKQWEAPSVICPFFGQTDQELSDICIAMLRRIDAVGLPANMESLRGTFFYDFLIDSKRLPRPAAGSARARGWLYPTLHETMTRKWDIPSAVATDWATRLVAALSLDPAERPSIQRLMRCAIFPYHLGVPIERLPDLAPNVMTLWSSIRPSTTNGGLVSPKNVGSNSSLSALVSSGTKEPDLDTFYGRFLTPPLTKEGTGPLLTLRPQVVRDRYATIHWSISACIHVARLRLFRSSQCRIAGFLLQYHRVLPRLLPSESALAALYNYKTGALDYFSGAVCVEMGRNKREAVVVLPQAQGSSDFFPNLHFRDEPARDAYLRWAMQLLLGSDGRNDDGRNDERPRQGGDDFPAWPFAIWEDLDVQDHRPDKRPRADEPLGTGRRLTTQPGSIQPSPTNGEHTRPTKRSRTE